MALFQLSSADGSVEYSAIACIDTLTIWRREHHIIVGVMEVLIPGNRHKVEVNRIHFEFNFFYFIAKECF
jgi:hypothetical protein